MKEVCSYCTKLLGEKTPISDKRVSHSICSECFEYFDKQLNGLLLNDYLDGFDAPVLIVNQEHRVVAANKKAAAMSGKTTREIFGLLGGEALECAYARLPGGCGKTSHCETCTIRIAVTQTLKTGRGFERKPVKLERNDMETEVTISTAYIDGMVRIVIED